MVANAGLLTRETKTGALNKKLGKRRKPVYSKVGNLHWNYKFITITQIKTRKSKRSGTKYNGYAAGLPHGLPWFKSWIPRLETHAGCIYVPKVP